MQPANRYRPQPAALMLVLIGCILFLPACSPDITTADSLRDCAQCPVMIELPPGRFLMGTAEQDRLIDPRTGKPATNDSPQHLVTITQSFAMGQYEVTVEEFAAFVSATGYQTVEKCMEFSPPGKFTISADTDWQNPGFGQQDNSPVGCISYYDAVAYTNWLSNHTGQSYRLPTESEWEYAARAGSTGSYFWGSNSAAACEFANVRSPGAHTISKRQIEADKLGFPCDDGFPLSAPVGSFEPNAFGLYDMQGNVWEWVADCNHKNYIGAPVDGSAWIDSTDAEQGCQFGVIRGGSYLNLVERSSATVRAGRPQSGGATNMGFRVVRGSDSQITAGQRSSQAQTFDDSPGAQIFADNCAACHLDSNSYRGLYGTDQAAVEAAIRSGGNNVMSMPAFDGVLSDTEIAEVARFVRDQNGWD